MRTPPWSDPPERSARGGRSTWRRARETGSSHAFGLVSLIAVTIDGVRRIAIVVLRRRMVLGQLRFDLPGVRIARAVAVRARVPRRGVDRLGRGGGGRRGAGVEDRGAGQCGRRRGRRR